MKHKDFNRYVDMAMAGRGLDAMRPVVEKELLHYALFNALCQNSAYPTETGPSVPWQKTVYPPDFTDWSNDAKMCPLDWRTYHENISG